MKIGEAAKKIGVCPDTLRQLEKRGVFLARRDWCGHRDFSDEEVSQIEEKLFPGRAKRDPSGPDGTAAGD